MCCFFKELKGVQYWQKVKVRNRSNSGRCCWRNKQDTDNFSLPPSPLTLIPIKNLWAYLYSNIIKIKVYIHVRKPPPPPPSNFWRTFKTVNFIEIFKRLSAIFFFQFSSVVYQKNRFTCSRRKIRISSREIVFGL